MAFFADLSDYAYCDDFHRPGTKNVGWLAPGYGFNTCKPDEVLLNLLWEYCSISVAQTRGLHSCEFCPRPESYLPPLVVAERKGQKLLFGSAEIRVFSKMGDIYAAPDVIYHYVSVHNYCPPEEFVSALNEGPRPPNREFLKRLSKLGFKWHRKSPLGAEYPYRSRTVQTPDGVKIARE
jgi:hypothetical protein